MPWSSPVHILESLEVVRDLNPKSILDVGIGFGKWGFLFRENLEASKGRVSQEQWKVRIDGIEIFEDYIAEHQRLIYDRIYVGDICQLTDELDFYDLFFTADVLEHIEKLRVLKLISDMKAKCRWMLLLIPIGDVWYNPMRYMFGNENDAHVSIWNGNEFDDCEKSSVKCTEGGNQHGMYLIKGNLDG